MPLRLYNAGGLWYSNGVMRLFIAIQLNDEMKDALVRIQDAMKRQGVTGNFTKRENLHLTLAFIGEYPDPEDVRDAMEQVGVGDFAISLDGVGAFGDLWWAGIGSGGGDGKSNSGGDGGDVVESDGGTEALKAAAKKLRRVLSDAGIPYDRKKFSPHITLVRRARSLDGRIPAGVFENVPAAGMTVSRVSLMRSDRGKNGMIYTEL